MHRVPSFDRREFQPMIAQGMTRGGLSRLQTPRTAATSKPEALANAAKFTAPPSRIAARAAKLNGADNDLISKALFLYRFDSQPGCCRQAGRTVRCEGPKLGGI
jgi:hypothetical protein